MLFISRERKRGRDVRGGGLKKIDDRANLWKRQRDKVTNSRRANMRVMLSTTIDFSLNSLRKRLSLQILPYAHIISIEFKCINSGKCLLKK